MHKEIFFNSRFLKCIKNISNNKNNSKINVGILLPARTSEHKIIMANSIINDTKTIFFCLLKIRGIDKKLKVTACPVHEYWLDIGQPDTFKKANKDWENNQTLNFYN